jgi:hypothetical protein
MQHGIERDNSFASSATASGRHEAHCKPHKAVLLSLYSVFVGSANVSGQHEARCEPQKAVPEGTAVSVFCLTCTHAQAAAQSCSRTQPALMSMLLYSRVQEQHPALMSRLLHRPRH